MLLGELGDRLGVGVWRESQDWLPGYGLGPGGLVVPFPDTGTLGRGLCFEEIMSFSSDAQAQTGWHVAIQTWD